MIDYQIKYSQKGIPFYDLGRTTIIGSKSLQDLGTIINKKNDTAPVTTGDKKDKPADKGQAK